MFGVYVCFVLYLWLERQTRDQKVPGSSPRKNGGRIFFSRVNFLCWLLFRYPFHPRVSYRRAVARKRSRSFCQKCRWQVTAKLSNYQCILSMWPVLNEVTLSTSAWLNGVHKTCTETAAVSHGTSHATTKQRCKYTTSVNIKKRAIKGYSHSNSA